MITTHHVVIMLISHDTGSGDPAKLSGLYRPLPIDNLYIQPEEWKEALSVFKVRNHALFIPPDANNKIDFKGTFWEKLFK